MAADADALAKRLARGGSELRFLLVHHKVSDEIQCELYQNDDLESMGRGAKGRRGIPLSYLYLAAFGYPFKWAKTRGGFRVEWLGMETEYPSYKLGLSLAEARYLVGRVDPWASRVWEGRS